ncbi:hypothetical protein BRADI_1g42415v3 [Brachypodium distachyon]|uniref:Uncharacterized protein n=1 Tax=Brachypodium distachyon TaxID=15368 RepID=A0A0Q3NLT0_BRADI|nr:hypothetical protein BRADI_1g42415v3 [Brachypodium distachyon]
MMKNTSSNPRHLAAAPARIRCAAAWIRRLLPRRGRLPSLLGHRRRRLLPPRYPRHRQPCPEATVRPPPPTPVADHRRTCRSAQGQVASGKACALPPARCLRSWDPAPVSAATHPDSPPRCAPALPPPAPAICSAIEAARQPPSAVLPEPRPAASLLLQGVALFGPSQLQFP